MGCRLVQEAPGPRRQKQRGAPNVGHGSSHKRPEKFGIDPERISNGPPPSVKHSPLQASTLAPGEEWSLSELGIAATGTNGDCAEF
jgi:hypothetical protein